MSEVSFDRIVRGEPHGHTRITTVPEGWAQGRSTFGGLVAAFGYEACASRAEAPARLITARLMEPVLPGRLEALVRPLRQGRSVQMWSASLQQNNRTVGIVDVIFGQARTSRVVVPAMPSPGGDPESGMAFGYIPKVSPEFLKNFDMRWTDGTPPYSASEPQPIGGFCRHQTEATGPSAVLGLFDAWPSPLLSQLDGPAPASTVYWSVHLTGAACPAGAWARFRSESVHAEGGYGTIHGHLWGPDGALLAWEEQLVAVYG